VRFCLLLGYCDPGHLVPIAQEAERSGWDAVAVPDAVFYPERVSAPYPYSADGSRFWGPETPFVDPWVAISFMAAATSTLGFVCSVLKLPIRHPLLVAKTVASVSALAGDRVALGVGLSWVPEEFEWLGQDFATRAGRTDEAIEAVRLVLSGDMVEHHGEHFDFGPLQVSPPPVAPVPIYVGGVSPGAVRRAARFGDGWISVSRPIHELGAAIADVRSQLQAGGRDPAGFRLLAVRSGKPDAGEIEQLAELGVTEVLVAPWWGAGPAPTLDDKLDAIRGYAAEVVQLSR
jgi:probable F420-dependent oxidoreductase